MKRENCVSWRIYQVTSAGWKRGSVFTVNSGTVTTKPYLFLLILLSSIFAGCIDIDNTVQSLNPFYTEEAVVELPQLEGEWLSFLALDDDVSPMNIKPWVFEDSKIKIFDENRQMSVAHTYFFQIEDSLFVDVVMANFNLDLFDAGNDEDALASDVQLLPHFMFTFWSMFHWRPVHIVYKVQMAEDNTSLVLTPLSLDWLEKIVEENPDLISLIEQSDSDSLLPLPLANATSETWMLLLEKYRHEEKAFPSDQMFRVLLKRCGNSHVVQFYKNGNPQVAMFPEDQEFSDGTQARANTPIYYAENGRVVSLILNRDWQAPAGFWLQAGTWVEYFTDGHLKYATLAKDWESPKGKLIKTGTTLEFSKNGKIKKTSVE